LRGPPIADSARANGRTEATTERAQNSHFLWTLQAGDPDSSRGVLVGCV
jgi:hypothetical protein